MSLPAGSRRLTLCTLLVCLTLAPVSGGVAPAPEATTDDGPSAVVSIGNTTEQLDPAAVGETRHSYGNASVDVAGAVAVQSERLRQSHAQSAFDERFFATDDRDQRLSLIRDRLTRSEREIETLRTEYRQLRGDYARSEISTRTYLRKAARTQAAMERHQQLLSTMLDRLSLVSSPPTPLQRHVRNLEGSLLPLGGPVSEHAVAGITGETQLDSLYVSAAGDTGLVMATVVDGTLTREALDETAQDPGASDQFSGQGTNDVRPRVEELYPWGYDNRISEPPVGGYGNSSIYWVDLDHAHGEMRISLDGTTTDVFRETQQKRAAAVPVTETLTNETDALELSVETTGPTGPMRVSLDGANGSTIDGTVFVDGQPVGETGDDGELWVVQPDGEFTLAAEGGGDRVTVST